MSSNRKLPALTVTMYMCGISHCVSPAAICKVNVVENNIHLYIPTSQNNFIRSSATAPHLPVFHMTCIILSLSDAVGAVTKLSSQCALFKTLIQRDHLFVVQLCPSHHKLAEE